MSTLHRMTWWSGESTGLTHLPCTVGGTTVDQLCRHLAIVTDPPETGRQRRRMPIDTATDRVEHVHGASLLHGGCAAAGTPVLPAPGALFPRVILRVDWAGCRERD